MTNHIDFHYDAKNDLVIITPHWHVKTEADVAAWASEYDRHFTRYHGRKMDAVFDLKDFRVDARVGAVWGEARANLIKKYFRFSYRVSAEGNVATHTFTSGVRYNASSAVASSIESAVEQILRHRREETASPA